jgi:hypothetical protein
LRLRRGSVDAGCVATLLGRHCPALVFVQWATVSAAGT